MKDKKRTLVLGDVHGGLRSMRQCFERSGFDPENDRLICLGDVADGWPDVRECFDELMKVKDLVYLLGNHDAWLMNWMTNGLTPRLWVTQGGQRSLESYGFAPDPVHAAFLRAAPMYHVDPDTNNVYVHGGFDWHRPLDEQWRDLGPDLGPGHTVFNWDRHLWEAACRWYAFKQDYTVPGFNEVFVGHTTTSFLDKRMVPLKRANVWNLDQGGGYEGKLTIMDADTHEYWQSDVLRTLYPELKSRG